MNTENNYSGMERKKTENEIKYFLRKRKEVPVNTLLIGINLLVFLLVEVTGSSLDTYHILRWGGCYTPACYSPDAEFQNAKTWMKSNIF